MSSLLRLGGLTREEEGGSVEKLVEEASHRVEEEERAQFSGGTGAEPGTIIQPPKSPFMSF